MKVIIHSEIASFAISVLDIREKSALKVLEL